MMPSLNLSEGELELSVDSIDYSLPSRAPQTSRKSFVNRPGFVDMCRNSVESCAIYYPGSCSCYSGLSSGEGF